VLRGIAVVDEINRLEGVWRPLWSEENGVRRTAIVSKMVIARFSPGRADEQVVWSDLIFEGEDERTAERIRRLTLDTVLGGKHDPLPTDYYVAGGPLRVVESGHLDLYFDWAYHFLGGPRRYLYRVKGKYLLLCSQWCDGFSATDHPAELSSWQGILIRYRRLRPPHSRTDKARMGTAFGSPKTLGI
jgi:hypothetical protein